MIPKMPMIDLSTPLKLTELHVTLLQAVQEKVVRPFNRTENNCYVELLAHGLITNLYPHFRITTKGRLALATKDHHADVAVDAGTPSTEEHPASTVTSADTALPRVDQ